MTDEVAPERTDQRNTPAPDALPDPPSTGALPDPDDREDFWGADPEAKGGFGKWELVAGAVLLVVALLVIVNLTGGDDDDDEADSAAVPAVTTPSGATVSGAGAGVTPPPPSTTTSLPGHTPPEVLQSTPVIVDDFEGPNADTLGTTNGNQPWTSALGLWGTRDGAAQVLERNETGARNIAVVEDGYVNQGTITAEIVNVAAGAGMTFKFRNVTNYFAVTADPAKGVWHVDRMLDGRYETLGTSLPAAVTGDVTLTVQLRGFWIDLYADGTPVLSVQSSSLPQAGGLGLFTTYKAIEETSFGGFIAGEFVADDAPPADEGAPPGTEPPGTTAP